MLADRQGNKLTGASSESLDHYEAAVRGFNTYRGDPVAHLDAAIASAPTMTARRRCSPRLILCLPIIGRISLIRSISPDNSFNGRSL